MIIDAIADLHGFYPKLEGGDLLIIGGDLTRRDEVDEHFEFVEWLDAQPYKKKIVMAGNHDTNIQKDALSALTHVSYLEDSGIKYECLKIWGTPWSLWFDGINPHCTAFTANESHLNDKFDLIPRDTDILISHSPCYGIFDKNIDGLLCGSTSLLIKLAEVKPIMHIFGHIHEQGGKELFLPWKNGTKCVNASIMNEFYKPVNKPTRITL